MKFAHLHNHSHYSLLDGASKIPAIVSRAKELGMDSLAITDHGNLHGALKFYKECRKQGVNPIIGYEAYIVGDRTARDAGEHNCHITILAQNRDGYRNLLRLASTAFLEGFYRKPRIDKEALCGMGEGLVVLSGCMSSEFARSLGDSAAALESIRPLLDRFADRFFIEIQRNGMPAQEAVTEATIDFARKHGLPMVATADCHYVNPEDAESQDVLLCVNTGSRKSKQDRMRMDGDQYYLRSPEEMYEQFKDQQEAVRRSAEIAESVDIEIDLGTRHFPAAEIRGESAQGDLFKLASQGLEKRRAGCLPLYLERLTRELKVINDLGFNEYFLIIEDFVRWSRERGIMSSARGSGVGSLVCYCLFISHVDPIEHGLLFERFLSYSRREAPDIDIDFDKDRRGEVMQYVKDKYGEDCVAQIGTFGTMGPKSAVKDVARAYSYPLDATHEITSLVPDNPFHNLADTFENPDFQRIYDTDHDARKIIDMALKLEGTARSLGTHAAAVVISDRPLVEYVPLAKGKKGVITQYDMGDCEEVGLMKMDFLGLRNMTILSECVRIIEETHGARIDLDKLVGSDAGADKTWELLSRGETSGVFQLESPGMTQLMVDLKPDCIEHICACIALYRPGPLDSGMVKEYVRGKNHKWNRLGHGAADKILDATYGVVVYQEQSMLLASDLAGIPMDEAYTLIKGISKKKPEIVNKYKQPFLDGCKSSGVDGTELWSTIEASARYQFNKSHSMGYAYVAYQTAWLKANYPAEFMAAVLNADISGRNFKRKDKLVEHLEDCQRMEITVTPPSVNYCGPKFKVVRGEIMFGLEAISGVSHAAAVEINKNGPYWDVWDLGRLDNRVVQRAMIRNLIRVGAVDHTIPSGESKCLWRARYEQALDRIIGQSKSHKWKDEDVKGVPYRDKYGGMLDLEKEYSGFYISSHPADEYSDSFNRFCTAHPATFNSIPAGTKVIIGGMISGIRRGWTKNEKPYAGFTVESSSGTIECIMWSEAYDTYQWIENGQVCFVHGRIDERGSRRSLTVKEVTLPTEPYWEVGMRIRGVLVEDLFQITGKYPGDQEMLLFTEGREVRLRSKVRICKDLLIELIGANAQMEVFYR